MKLAPLYLNENDQPGSLGWQTDGNRFVAFMDIMGFKDLVTRKPHQDIKHLLLQMNQTRSVLLNMLSQFKAKSQKEMTEKDERIRSFTFSDSIVFVTKEDSIKDLFLLSVAVAICQEASIQSGVPTKGAISHGFMTTDFQRSIFFGQPIIDSYLLQEELFYYGVVIDNNVERILKESIAKKDSDLEHNHFIRLATPFKTGKIVHFNLRMKNLLEDQLEYLYNNVAGHARKYVDNTIDMYKLMTERDTDSQVKLENS